MDDIHESGGPLSARRRLMTGGGGRRATCILFDTDSVWAEVRVALGAALVRRVAQVSVPPAGPGLLSLGDVRLVIY